MHRPGIAARPGPAGRPVRAAGAGESRGPRDAGARSLASQGLRPGSERPATDATLGFEVVIDPPVGTVFEHGRDPRRISGGDLTHRVSDATAVPEGVGTTAHVVAWFAVLSEDIRIECAELVPDRRIVFEAVRR